MKPNGCRSDKPHTQNEREERDAGALSLWRTHGAAALGEQHRADLAACVAGILSTDANWNAAASGSVPAACGLALRLGSPDRIGLRVDMVMTVLLASALHNSTAAAVLAHVLGRMPIDPRTRAALASSWSARAPRARPAGAATRAVLRTKTANRTGRAK
jgi:hypothetical protein